LQKLWRLLREPELPSGHDGLPPRPRVKPKEEGEAASEEAPAETEKSG
jgi:hypothetical protein